MSTKNEAYELIYSKKRIIKEFVQNEIEKRKKNPCLFVYDSIDSTNNEAKRVAVKGCEHASIVCANSQTEGRGRMGRSFVSEENGIYFSIILRPKSDIAKILKLTAGAAVAVKRVVEKYCSEVSIKWVNDIYISDKKVCGILTEAISGCKSGGVEYVVVGIGVNVFGKAADFGNELSDIVTTIEEHSSLELDKNRIIAQIYCEFMDMYDKIENFSAIMEEYKNSSCVIGKKVFAIRADERKKVTVNDINDNGELVCTDEEGKEIIISSGEISIRFK